MIDMKSFPPSNIDTIDYKVHSADKIDFGKEFKYALFHQPEGFKPLIETYNNTPLHSYAIVCNTDTSKGTGQHWFAVFISTDHKDPNDSAKPWIRIELFNSAGGGTTHSAFNQFWQEQSMKISRETGLRCTFDIVTTIQHQSPDTGNCGSYSLFYIFSRLKGAKPSEFNDPNSPITDHAMRKFREVCFQVNGGSSMFTID